MTRFEIQDIIRQNKDGVTFRALDKSNDQIVSLRRFFPFGQCDENEEGGEGLDPTEGKAFSNACERLSHVQHPALRKTIYGDVDPIDGMPYLVTEWVEGESLSDVLGSNAMPADMIIALVQQVFDVCKLLSETLQSEAVWIDTNPQSIIVCNPTENPTFSFRICPFKWLGTSKSHLKDMTSIVSLIEELMGWKSKLVSDQAGKGLGGYIKLLRQYPDMEMNKAVLALPNHSIEITEVATETNTRTPTTLFPLIPTANASFFNKKSITVMSVSACITGALIFFFYQQQTKKIDQNITVPSEVYDPSDNPEIVSNPEKVTPETEPPVTTPETTSTTTETVPKEVDTNPQKPETTTTTSTSWSPADISATAWYDASTATIKDGTVSIANAASSGANISGPASLAANGIGNLQAVQFNGTNQYLTGDCANTGETLTVFFVGKSLNTKQDAFAGMMSIWEDKQVFDWNNLSSAVLFSQNDTLANSIYTHRNKIILSSSTGTLTNGFLAATIFDGSTHTLYLNGTPSAGVASTGSFNATKVILGARWQNNAVTKPYWNGNFGEVIICNAAYSASDRQKIEGYLAHKWDLAGNLPADHPYKTSAPDSSSKLETLASLPTKEKLKPTPPVGRLWSPDEISTAAWYDAADASTITSSSGGAVSQWNDKSGGKRHAIQGTETDRPTTGIRKLNGLNVVDFSRDYLVSPLNIDRSETDKLSVFTVFACDEIVGSYALFGADKGDWGRFALLNFDDNKVAEWGISNGSGTTPFAASRTPDTASHILSINLHTSASNGSLVALDGDKVTVFTESRGKANYTTTAIGAISQTGSNAHDGYIAEQIYITDLTSTAERQKIEGYLAHKWSLTGNLPADHPYKKSAPESSSKPETLVNLPKKETIIEKVKPTPLVGRMWSPNDISTAAWYDATDASTLTASSGAVSQWRDKSGNNLHLAQGKAANQPTTGAKINDHNALDFTGDVMTTASNPFGTTVSNAFVIAVYKVDSIQSGTLFSLTGSEDFANRWQSHAPFGDGTLYFDCGGTAPGLTRVGTASGISAGNVVLTSFYCSSTNNSQQVYKNGSFLIGDNTGHSASTVGNVSVGGLTPNYQDTTIGEFIIINGTVDDATRQNLEGYLAHKWGTTASLPANHPYKSSAPIPSILTSSDTEIIKTLKVGDPVTLQGIVKSAKFSSTGKSIYLSFSDPNVETDIRVVIHENEYDGTAFTEEEFAKLVGKNLVFGGTVYTESFNDRPPFVKITEKAQIKLTTKTPEKAINPVKAKNPEIANNSPIFTPNDAASLAKLELKDPASVSGIVKSVKIPKPGGGLYFSFSDPLDRRQIQVVTYQKGFENGYHDSAAFKKIEEEYQNLVGKMVTFNGTVSRQAGNNTSQFVFISKREQIVVEDTKDKSESDVDKPNDKPKAKGPIDNINPGTRIIIKGNVKTIQQNADKTAIVISFFDSKQDAPLRGVVYKKNYKDPFDIKNFEQFLGKPVSIDGVLIIDSNNDRLIEITNLNQISILQK